jgi:pantoate--beta-alanine ligase
MIIIKKAEAISDYLLQQKGQQKKTGFVPTMGALHQGHLSLIEASRKENDLTVCSIFINPTQFTNSDDFRLYPKTIEKDIENLLAAQCDILFLPPVDEIYPGGYNARDYELGPIENTLEGLYRPGHFQGVCQVVDRLLEIVNPDSLYLGQKDYQQCMVIRKLLQLTEKEDKVRLVIVPTIREEDGLAMSSRNLRLSAEQRVRAATIFKVLSRIKEELGHEPVSRSIENGTAMLEAAGFTVDYVEVAEATSLAPSSSVEIPLVALVAASIGSVRLIDNMLLNQGSPQVKPGEKIT